MIKYEWGGICFDWKLSVETYINSDLMKLWQKIGQQK